MKKLYKLIMSFIMILASCLLASCYNLGDYKNDIEYCESFDLSTITNNEWLAKNNDLDFDDFYNKDAIQKFNCPIEADYYRYIAIKANKDLDLGSIAFYVQSEERSSSIRFSMYVVDELPTTLFVLDLVILKLREYINSDAVDKVLEIVSGNEPDYTPLSTASVFARTEKWNSAMFSRYSGSKQFSIKEDQYILIKVENNCGIKLNPDNYVDKKDMLDEAEEAIKEKVKFKFTAVLIQKK